MKRVAVITSSDKGYRGEREDLSGPTVKEIMEKNGYQVVSLEILPDERDPAQSARNPGSYAGLQFDYYEEGYVKQGNCRNPGRHFDHKSSRKP